MFTLKADATEPRQLPEAGPLLLWRDAAAGGREGLALMVEACGNAKCECRDVSIEGWQVDDRLLAVVDKGETVQFLFAPPLKEAERHVLLATVNVDSGAFKPDPKRSRESGADWLRGALDAELLAALRQRFEAAKLPRPAPPVDWRNEDFTWWKPGMPVGWRDLHEDDERAAEVQLDGVVYVLGDIYCVAPGCECVEVEVIVWREEGSDGELIELGRVTVAPARLDAAQLHAHGKELALVRRIWTAWCAAHLVGALLAERRAEVRRVAPDFEAHVAGVRKKRETGRKIGPNQPCPCGSGKKYKKCCMRG